MKRILFVDDESNVLEGIRRMLCADRNRWSMEFAVGGEAALQACELTSFDVVISDMRMPVMDGATLLGHIRDRYPGTSRIILSGNSETSLINRSVSVAHRFLVKPCSAAELRSTIERVCGLQDLLSNAEIRRVVGAIGELPSLSSSYAALRQEVSNPYASAASIAAIIEQDVAMTAKVLQLVNSAFFGLAQTMTNLRSAVNYLGIDTITNLVLVAEAFSRFTPGKRIPQSVCEQIQRHAQCVATIAGRLPIEPKLRDLTITSALLHDIGRLVLASKLPDQFCSVLSRASERKCQLFEAEEELLGTSHAEIGSYLLGLWGLPYLATEAVAHHHRPTRIPHSGLDISVALYLADWLAHESTVSPDSASACPLLLESDRACLEALGVLDRLPEFRELAQQCQAQNPGLHS